MTLIQHKNAGTLFHDEIRCISYKIKNIWSEHKINHTRVIYLVSICGKYKQQFSDKYFEKLLLSGEIKIQA